MNGYPFAGPGGQKTLHRRAALHDNGVTETDCLARELVNQVIDHLRGDRPRSPQSCYAAVMEYDNR